eukprot:TRINITY_DN2021_c0_g1_i5.p1 TRINITY_DN2021_c0_g1~~TRINITY_DN2021_c0_g1_i5.p1  ORF type:complete len:324 (-),score=67.10 TRINITY_DN2021_c0_g1_i5:823-1773(-)
MASDDPLSYCYWYRILLNFNNMDDMVVKQYLERAMESKNCDGKLVFGMLGGSNAYNLNVPESDLDFIGLYLTPTSVCLSLEKPTFIIDNRNDPEEDRLEYDYTLYDFTRFCGKLLDGEPTVVEALFLDEHYDGVYKTDIFEEFLQFRDLFITKAFIKNSLKVVKYKLRRFKKDPTMYKLMIHASRLSRECLRSFEGKPKVWIDGEEREQYMKIRYNNIDFDQLVSEVNHRVLKIEELLKKTDLPEKTNLEMVDSWYLGVRMRIFPDFVNARVLSISAYTNNTCDIKENAQMMLEKNDVPGILLTCSISGATLHGFK